MVAWEGFEPTTDRLWAAARSSVVTFQLHLALLCPALTERLESPFSPLLSGPFRIWVKVWVRRFFCIQNQLSDTVAASKNASQNNEESAVCLLKIELAFRYTRYKVVLSYVKHPR